MKRIFSWGFVVLWGLSAFGQEKTTHVIIFAGQSNLNGTTSRSYYEPSMRREEIPFAWFMTLYDWSRTNSGDFTALDRRFFQGKDRYACELSAGAMIADSIEEDVVVLLVNRSGSSIHKEWDPRLPLDPNPAHPGREGAMFSHLVNFTRSKVAQLKDPGKVAFSLIWHQGESDAKPGELSEAYYERFTQFYDSLKRHISPEIKVFPIKIYNPKHQRKDVVVNAAFEQIAKENEFITFLDVDDLWNSTAPVNSLDEQHWSAIGYLNLGERVAQEWLSVYQRDIQGTDIGQENGLLICDDLADLNYSPDYSLFLLPSLPGDLSTAPSTIQASHFGERKYLGRSKQLEEILMDKENSAGFLKPLQDPERLKQIFIEPYACRGDREVFLFRKPRPDIKVYPNPFATQIRVQGKARDTVEIYDLMGSLIFTDTLPEKGSLQVPIQGPKGIYLLKTPGSTVRVYKH